MIRTKFTALMYAGALAATLLALLAATICIIITFPVTCTVIAALGLLCIYYRSTHKQFKPREKTTPRGHQGKPSR